jgi:hypothetical protein
MRSVADDGNTAPIAVRVRVDTAFPVVRPSNRTPLGLKPEHNELLRGLRLFSLSEMGHPQLLPIVREGAVTPPRALPCLVAEPLAEELRVVQELRGAVAQVARITTGTGPLIVELVVAGLSTVGRSRATLDEYGAAPVTLAVVEGTATVVVGRGRAALEGTGGRLEFVQHPLELLQVTSKTSGSPRATAQGLLGRRPACLVK